MTNHIEELMKAVGVEPETITDYELNEYKVYPDFTPAKQLELIKLIGYFNFFQDEISNWVMTHHDINRVRSYRVEGNKDFSATLANFILYLIVKKQLDKSEVKKILEH